MRRVTRGEEVIGNVYQEFREGKRDVMGRKRHMGVKEGVKGCEER